MEKPISVAIYDLQQNLARVINESKLPICIVEHIMKDFYEESVKLSQQQLVIDKEAYEKSLKEEEGNDN